MSSERLRVLYVISCRSSGHGGHYHSLRDLVEALAPRVDAAIACLGRARPPVLFDGTLDATFHPWTARATPATVDALVRRIAAFRPHVVHSFDALALAHARVAAAATRRPLVHTLAGGPSPRRVVPRAPDVVLFSRENHDDLAAHPRMKGARLHLLPGRVRPVRVDRERVAGLRATLGLAPGELVMLRINRIVPVYEPVSRNFIDLGRRLRAGGLPVRVVVLGAAEDPAVAARLRAEEGEGVHVVTDPAFTRRAAEVADAADVVLGTGRSLMEAASLGKVLLVPLANRRCPRLLTPETLDELWRCNFSQRSRTAATEEELFAAIERTLRDPAARQACAAFARRTWERHFQVDVPAYVRLYEDARRRPAGWSALPGAIGTLSLEAGLDGLRSWQRARRAARA